MVHRNYIHTFIAILIISMLSLHTMAYSHHSNDSIASTAIDANESSKSKVRRIGPKDNLSATPAAGDSLSIVQANDSLPFVAVDSATISQTTQAPKVKTESALDAVVDFTAQDSLVFEAGNLAFLYGKSVILSSHNNSERGALLVGIYLVARVDVKECYALDHLIGSLDNLCYRANLKRSVANEREISCA